MSRKNLRTKISAFFPHKDKDGEFISYCNYKVHRGIVMRPKICERRKCNHYNKMYVSTKLYN